jgi:hypothetical protein
MVPLSPATLERVAALFQSPERGAAEQLLAESCADNLPFNEGATPMSLERIRFAVLKVSGGSLEKLRKAIEWAQIDSRDVFVWAGFHERPDAHLAWQPGRANR